MSAPRKQCAKCPWKVGVNPDDIPNGYDRAKHAALKETIAEPGALRVGGSLRAMACHETPVGAEVPCVGWLVHQIGEGQNLGLRLQIITGKIDGNVETVGEQHSRFEDTLPRRRKPRRALPSRRVRP
jgi:hypothetical protein